MKMKVFISHSYNDIEFVERLKNGLTENGVEVFQMLTDLNVGEAILDTIKKAINNSDFIIVVLSKESIRSKWVNLEISTVLLNEKSKKESLLMPVLMEDCEIPISISDRFYADFRHSFEKGLDSLLKGLSKNKSESFNELEVIEASTGIDRYSSQIKNLKEVYNRGNLTIFCGAGVSFDSGIPTWNKLLKELLKEVYSDHKLPDIDAKLADLFQKRQNLSPLIVAKYLKTGLGKTFLSTVRDVLYQEYSKPSGPIKELVELCRPRRNRKSLKAIVTFNFDDIIEEALIEEKIACKSIYDEGERFSEDQIPVFHPHGFLPREVELDERHNIVFSEDAYHSQFIDPFSWSNLTQLNYLSTSTCLFVGISLTDPNMRRLLDVSERKNKQNQKIHYLIKKRYTLESIFDDPSMYSEKNKALLPIIEEIEEQDAKDLGFNTIWINDFTDIPLILKMIGE